MFLTVIIVYVRLSSIQSTPKASAVVLSLALSLPRICDRYLRILLTMKPYMVQPTSLLFAYVVSSSNNNSNFSKLQSQTLERAVFTRILKKTTEGAFH